VFEFKKTQRLLKKCDYDSVFQQAKKMVTDDFIMFYKHNEVTHARLGLAISKKALAKAHDRNRIKRLLREQFRQTRLPAVDVVFLAKRGILNKTNLQLSRQLSKTWEKLSS